MKALPVSNKKPGTRDDVLAGKRNKLAALEYTGKYHLRLNTGIDPPSHWTSEQWTLLARRSQYHWGISDYAL